MWEIMRVIKVDWVLKGEMVVGRIGVLFVIFVGPFCEICGWCVVDL